MRLGKLALLVVAGTALLLLPRRSSGDRITPRLQKNPKANTTVDKASDDSTTSTVANPPPPTSNDGIA